MRRRGFTVILIGGAMKPDATESRIKRLVDGVCEYVTHSAIAGAAVALTGFASEHWFADLFSHLSIPGDIRHVRPQVFDIRIGFVALGVAIIAWDVPRRSRAQPVLVPLDRRAEMQADIVGRPDRTSDAAPRRLAESWRPEILLSGARLSKRPVRL